MLSFNNQTFTLFQDNTITYQYTKYNTDFSKEFSS